MDNKPIYKTAAELGIEQWEHDGLVALIGPLSREELGMDMRYPGVYTETNHPCGSAGCIGGWLFYKAKKGAMTFDYSSNLSRLFFPGYAECGAYEATAPQSARAIVNFLVTGDPQWDAVMADAS